MCENLIVTNICYNILKYLLPKMSFYFYRLTRTKTMGSLSHELISTTRWKTSWTNVTKPHDRSVEENRQSRSFASPASRPTCKYLVICTYLMYNNVIWSVSVNNKESWNTLDSNGIVAKRTFYNFYIVASSEGILAHTVANITIN